MQTDTVTIEKEKLQRLLSLASPDAALVYLYLRAGNPPENAQKELKLTETALSMALANLRQMGLWGQEPQSTFLPGERPTYSEQDVLHAMDTDGDFRSLYGEIQRLLGKVLTTEELKLLLGIRRYFGLPNEVISVLVYYCRDRSRKRGSLRNPSLRTIEKEACRWAEQGIETLEQAAAYIQDQNRKESDLEKLKQLLQIRGRNLTAREEEYALSWLSMGFPRETVADAYERTCLNTGGLNWAYMNKILTRWHEAGLHTLDEIRARDRKPTPPKGASGQLGQAELDAIRRIMEEG